MRSRCPRVNESGKPRLSWRCPVIERHSPSCQRGARRPAMQIDVLGAVRRRRATALFHSPSGRRLRQPPLWDADRVRKPDDRAAVEDSRSAAWTSGLGLGGQAALLPGVRPRHPPWRWRALRLGSQAPVRGTGAALASPIRDPLAGTLRPAQGTRQAKSNRRREAKGR